MKTDHYHKIVTLDMHTGGEPLRIVMEGFPTFERASILEIRRQLKNQYEPLRKAIMWEPRGHADMYGLIRVAPERDDSAFGVIFMHNEGYSTMCGHATIAVGRAAVDMGWVKKVEPLTSFYIDAPCGQLKVMVSVKDGEVTGVSFDNVPSFYVGTYEANIPSIGAFNYHLAYGGAFYAYVHAQDINLSLEKSSYGQILQVGQEIKRHLVAEDVEVSHPFSDDLSFLYGVIFTGPSKNPHFHSRNVCVFADGEVDRCATGSGISGRAAVEYTHGSLDLNETMAVESITGSHLEVKIVDTSTFGTIPAIIPRVSGMAHYTGRNEFWLDPEDPFKEGFFLR